MSNIFCFGTNGGCLDAFYLLKEIRNDVDQLFFLSDDHTPGEIICDHEVAGPFKYAISPEAKGQEFIYQCGSVKNHKKRHAWFQKAVENGMVPKTLISDHSYIHSTAVIGCGSIVYPGVKIMANVKLGENCIVLPNAVINHDSMIGNHCIINSLCVLNGGVELGKNCYVGAASSLKENITIPSETTIGMSSIVLHSLEKSGLYFGSPAKFIR